MPTLLGLDYGQTRIGIAISDPEQTVATPLTTHDRRRQGSFFTWLAALIRQRDVTALVLGLPLTAAGGEGRMAERVRSFAARLQERLGIPVVLWDERYTTQEAQGRLREDGRRRRPRGQVDALAATLMLQSYLDRQGGRSAAGEGVDPA
jgi:putative Holliday junction resolvase